MILDGLTGVKEPQIYSTRVCGLSYNWSLHGTYRRVLRPCEWGHVASTSRHLQTYEDQAVLCQPAVTVPS